MFQNVLNSCRPAYWTLYEPPSESRVSQSGVLLSSELVDPERVRLFDYTFGCNHEVDLGRFGFVLYGFRHAGRPFQEVASFCKLCVLQKRQCSFWFLGIFRTSAKAVRADASCKTSIANGSLNCCRRLANSASSWPKAATKRQSCPLCTLRSGTNTARKQNCKLVLPPALG